MNDRPSSKHIDNPVPDLSPAAPLVSNLTAMGAHWGWFVGLGILLLLLGLAAGIYVIAATVASVLFVESRRVKRRAKRCMLNC